MRGAIVKQRGSSKNHILTHSKHVGRTPALIKKAPARKDAVEINDATLTVATATSVLCHHRKSVDFSITSSVHSSLPSISALWHRSHFWVPVFGLTGKSKRNLIHALK